MLYKCLNCYMFEDWDQRLQLSKSRLTFLIKECWQSILQPHSTCSLVWLFRSCVWNIKNVSKSLNSIPLKSRISPELPEMLRTAREGFPCINLFFFITLWMSGLLFSPAYPCTILVRSKLILRLSFDIVVCPKIMVFCYLNLDLLWKLWPVYRRL